MLAAEFVLTLSARQPSPARTEFGSILNTEGRDFAEMILRDLTLLLLSLSPLAESLDPGAVRIKSDQNCPLLDGVFVSIMRRIFNPGYHKVLLSSPELCWNIPLLPRNFSPRWR